MNRWFLVTLAALFSSLALPVISAENQILRHIEALSRDYYYIHIDDPTQPFQTRDIVGGEHEKNYQILGFQDETFIIVIESIEGEANYLFHDDENEIERKKHGGVVTVKDRQAWIDIGISAHPYAEYILTVQKYE